MFLIANAHIFSYLLTSEQIPQKLAALMLSITTNPLIVKLLVMVVLLIAGCFLDNAVAVILLTPILYPVMASLGVDLVYFGVLLVFVLAIGQVTPPVGLCLFLTQKVAKITTSQMVKSIMPFVIMMIVCLFIFTYVPPLVTWLPVLFNLC